MQVSTSYEADDYIEKEIAVTETPLRDAIELLLRNRLTDRERELGLIPEFEDPNYAKRRRNFRLVDAKIMEHTAVLVFEDPDFFTSGGSARASIMESQITKTALQFQEVQKVEIKGPEHLFQP